MKANTTAFLVGLTGGIACGKTTVANYLAEQGAYLIDTDIIARQVVMPDTPTHQQIHKLFGDAYFLADGHLNRQAIKQHIFSDNKSKQRYEAIILPAIRQATLQAITRISPDVCYTLLIVPLLFEKGLDRYTDYNISVDVPTATQIQRGVKRKPEDEGLIRQIIAAQMPREARNQRADYVIDNSVTLEKLYRQLDKLHVNLSRLAKCKKEIQ